MFKNKTKRKLKEIIGEYRAKRRIKKDSKNRFKMIPDKKKNHKWIVIPVVFVLLFSLIVYTLYDNGRIVVDYVTVTHSQVPVSFDGYRILQITDIHGRKFGVENKNLVEAINNVEYDMILLTGDYMSSPESGDYWDIIDLLDDLDKKDVPVLYILGESDYTPLKTENLNENWNMCIYPKENNKMMEYFEDIGVKFVYPISTIEKNGETIFFTGINYVENKFDEVNFDVDKHFSICVTHKPIDYDVNARLAEVNKSRLHEVDYDLSVSGHTHGGEIRLPLLGAVYVEGKGVFPQEEDTKGLHSDGQGRFNYISPGLGADGFPGFRFYNPPTISVITLKRG